MERNKEQRLCVDWWVVNDAASSVLPELLGSRRLLYPEKVKVFIDHDVPCGSVDAALAQKKLIQFALDQGCELFNGAGISYQIMLDRFVKKGQVVALCSPHAPIFGAVNALGLDMTPPTLADSMLTGTANFTMPQACRVEITAAPQPPLGAKDLALTLIARGGSFLKGRAIEFVGTGALELPLHDKITLCQMVNATGAVCASFGSEDASGAALRLDPQTLCQLVAGPHENTQVKALVKIAPAPLDEVFIGGCSGGRIEDLRTAAKILRGRRVPPRLRLMIAPATAEVFSQAADEGLLDIFFDAGALVMGQGCSVCWGKSQGLIGEGETLLSTGSRCSRGCTGPVNSSVYVCSPEVAARCALAGKICDYKEAGI